MVRKTESLLPRERGEFLFRVIKDGRTVDCLFSNSLVEAAALVKEKWAKYCKRSNLSVELVEQTEH